VTLTKVEICFFLFIVVDVVDCVINLIKWLVVILVEQVLCFILDIIIEDLTLNLFIAASHIFGGVD